MACSSDAGVGGAVLDLSCPSPASGGLRCPSSTSERMRGVTWCVLEEVKSGDWAIGGRPVTTESVHALAGGDLSLPV